MKRDDSRPLDEVAIAAALQRLEALVVQHPELVGATGPENVNVWIATLETDERGS